LANWWPLKLTSGPLPPPCGQNHKWNWAQLLCQFPFWNKLEKINWQMRHLELILKKFTTGNNFDFWEKKSIFDKKNIFGKNSIFHKKLRLLHLIRYKSQFWKNLKLTEFLKKTFKTVLLDGDYCMRISTYAEIRET